jgi:glyoxylase-like metal-dependent hydrolase (beta-lactamase superfamily II)
MDVDQLAPGLWRWTAPHPDWTEGDDWEREVGCVYYEAPEATVLIDPLVPPAADRDRFFEALDRDVERRGLAVAIVLTCEWHGRSAQELAERYGATGEARRGLEAHELPEIEERVWWIPEHGALVPGDVLLGDGAGGLRVCPDSWLGERSSHESIRAALHPLLDLPVERVLVSHGEPVLEGGRHALERALRD